MADRPEKGMSEAHTPRDPGGESAGDGVDPAADRADRDQVTGEDLGKADPLARSVAAIAAELDQARGDQLDLLPADLDPVGDMEKIAEIGHAKRRGRGRPKGSPNARNGQVFDYLEALGHRDPATTLSFYQSMDVGDLARYLRCDRDKAASIQVSAASKLMDFKYAKKPVTLDLGEKAKGLPVMMIGELNMTQVNHHSDGPERLGQPISQTIETIDETEPASVRHDDDASHDPVKPLKKQD